VSNKAQRWSAAARAMNHAASLWEILPKLEAHRGDVHVVIFAEQFVKARTEAEKAIKEFHDLMPKKRVDPVVIALLRKVNAAEELIKRTRYLIDEVQRNG